MIIPFVKNVSNFLGNLRKPIDLTPTPNVRVRDVFREFNELPIIGFKRLAGGVAFQPNEPTPKSVKIAIKQLPQKLKEGRNKKYQKQVESRDRINKALKEGKSLTQALKDEESALLDLTLNFAPVGVAATIKKPAGKVSGVVSGVVANTGKKAVSKLERGFVTSAKEVIPEATKIAGQYVPRNTDKLATKARNLVKTNILAAEDFAMKGADDKAVAIASELIKKYGDDAAKATDPAQAAMFYDKAAQIANTIAPKLTEAGRTVQAASILGRLTPEGQIRFAAKEILRYNSFNPGKKIPELTGEQAQFIADEMRAITTMANSTEKAQRFQDLQGYIRDLVPSKLIDKVITVWKAGLLTGVKTSGLNLFSNISHSVSEVAKDAPAAIVDSVASLFTGKRTKTFTVRGQAGGMKEGFQKGLTYFKKGFDERDIAKKLDYKKVNFGKGVVARSFQAYTDTVFRAIGAADQPFYYGALSRSLSDQALAQAKNAGLKGKAARDFAENLVQSPTEEMIRYGVADATTAVFQNQTKLGKVAKAIQSAPGGEFVVPFGRTPSAVATQILRYTPAVAATEIFSQVAKRKFDQRLFSEAVGRGMVGTAVLALGYKMAEKGLIALDRPTNEREQKLWELEGRKPNSVKVGNKWRSPIVLGPAGNLLLIGGHFQKAFKENGSPTGAISQALAGSAKSFTEQTFLTGVNQAVSALTDPGRSAKGYFESLVSSVIPTLASDIARATDPLERRPENALERTQAKIPGLRNQLEPRVDVLGREINRIGNPLEVLIDPTRPQKETTTPVITEFRRLNKKGYKVSPTLLGDKEGYSVLTPQENTKLWKRAGSIANEKIEKLLSNDKYQAMKDDLKANTIEQFVEKAKIYARAEMVIQVTDGLQGEELKQKLSRLKEGELLTRDVFNAYVEMR